MKTSTYIAVLLSAAVLTSCKLFDDEVARIADINASAVPTARIKFNNFSSGSVAVNFFANTQKMTGINTTACSPASNGALPTVDSTKTKCLATGIESTTGVNYGGNAAGGLYLAIAPGSYTFTAQRAGLDTVVSSVTQTIADGKYYSMYLSGIYSATATPRAEAFIVEDPIPAGIDYTKALVRFVNAVPNGTGDITMYVTNTTTSTETALGGAVAYKAAGAFTAIPEGVYNGAAKYGTTGITGLTRNTMSFFGGHAYTITARGSTATASTLALDLTENQR